MYVYFICMYTNTNLSSVKSKIYHRDDDIDAQRMKRAFPEFDTELL